MEGLGTFVYDSSNPTNSHHHCTSLIDLLHRCGASVLSKGWLLCTPGGRAWQGTDPNPNAGDTLWVLLTRKSVGKQKRTTEESRSVTVQKSQGPVQVYQKVGGSWWRLRRRVQWRLVKATAGVGGGRWRLLGLLVLLFVISVLWFHSGEPWSSPAVVLLPSSIAAPGGHRGPLVIAGSSEIALHRHVFNYIFDLPDVCRSKPRVRLFSFYIAL